MGVANEVGDVGVCGSRRAGRRGIDKKMFGYRTLCRSGNLGSPSQFVLTLPLQWTTIAVLMRFSDE